MYWWYTDCKCTDGVLMCTDCKCTDGLLTYTDCFRCIEGILKRTVYCTDCIMMNTNCFRCTKGILKGTDHCEEVLTTFWRSLVSHEENWSRPRPLKFFPPAPSVYFYLSSRYRRFTFLIQFHPGMSVYPGRGDIILGWAYPARSHGNSSKEITSSSPYQVFFFPG